MDISTKTLQMTHGQQDSAQNILKELSEHKTGVLGTLQKGTQAPQLSCVYYKVYEDFTIGFATKAQTRKHGNLKSNKEIQLLVYNEELQLTIQVSGEAHEVTDSDVATKIIENAYWQANRQDFNSPPIGKMHAGSYIAYLIVPTRITMAHFLKTEKAGHDMFETLDFKLT